VDSVSDAAEGSRGTPAEFGQILEAYYKLLAQPGVLTPGPAGDVLRVLEISDGGVILA